MHQNRKSKVKMILNKNLGLKCSYRECFHTESFLTFCMMKGASLYYLVLEILLNCFLSAICRHSILYPCNLGSKCLFWYHECQVIVNSTNCITNNVCSYFQLNVFDLYKSDHVKDIDRAILLALLKGTLWMLWICSFTNSLLIVEVKQSFPQPI